MRYEDEYYVPLAEEELYNVHPDFQSFSMKDLSAVNCMLFTKKNK